MVMSEGIEQVENVNDVKPPTPVKKMRDRREYMQAYYHKRKTPATCSGCNSVFSCSSSMKHHEETNILCLIARIVATCESIRDQFPEEYADKFEPTMQKEMNRMKNIVARTKKENNSNDLQPT
jgi:hypothetical protein